MKEEFMDLYNDVCTSVTDITMKFVDCILNDMFNIRFNSDGVHILSDHLSYVSVETNDGECLMEFELSNNILLATKPNSFFIFTDKDKEMLRNYFLEKYIPVKRAKIEEEIKKLKMQLDETNNS